MIYLILALFLQFLSETYCTEDLVFLSQNDVVYYDLEQFQGRNFSAYFTEGQCDEALTLEVTNEENFDTLNQLNASGLRKVVQFQLLNVPVSENYLFGLSTSNDVYIFKSDLQMSFQINIITQGESECIDIVPIYLEEYKGQSFDEIYKLLVREVTYSIKKKNLSEVICSKEDISGPLYEIACQYPKITFETSIQKDNNILAMVACGINIDFLQIYSIESLMYDQIGQFSDDKCFTEIVDLAFYEDQYFIVLDRQLGLYFASYRLESDLISFEFYNQITFMLLSKEKFLGMSLMVGQGYLRQLPVGVSLSDEQNSLVVISDQYLYETIIPENFSDIKGQQIKVYDKILIRNYFNLIPGEYDVIQTQIIYDSHFYFICIVKGKTSDLLYTRSSLCQRLERHEKTKDVKLLFDKSSNTIPLMIGQIQDYNVCRNGQTNIFIFENNYYQQTVKVLMFPNLKSEIIIKSIQNTNCEDNITIVFTESILEQETKEYLKVINQEKDVVFSYSNPFQKHETFSQKKGVIIFEDFQRGPSLKFKVGEYSPDNLKYINSLAIRMGISQVDYVQEYLKDSLFAKSFQQSNFVTSFISMQNHSLLILIYEFIENTNNYTINGHIEKLFDNLPIKNIYGVNENYLIEYDGLFPIQLQWVQIKQNQIYANQSCKYNIVVSEIDFMNITKNDLAEYQVFTQPLYNNVFILLNYADGSQVIYFKDFTDPNYEYFINLGFYKYYEQPDFSFLQSGVLIVKQNHQIMALKLEMKSAISYEIQDLFVLIENKNDQFIYFIQDRYQLEQEDPCLIIVGEEIQLYILRNLISNPLFISILPTFDFTIDQNKYNLVHIQSGKLFVPMYQNQGSFEGYFVYDILKTGQERLIDTIQNQKDKQIDIVRVTSLETLNFRYCLQNQNFTEPYFYINCSYENRLIISLQDVQQNQDHSPFSLNIGSYSSLDLNKEIQKFNVEGSFEYQEVVINAKDSPPDQLIEIFKSKDIYSFSPSMYFEGPIFDYSIEGENVDQLQFSTLVQNNQDIIIDDEQNIYEIRVTSEFLATVGDKHISISKMGSLQADKVTQKVNYEQFNQILRDHDIMFPVHECRRVFLEKIKASVVSKLYLMTLICSLSLLKENNTLEKDLLAFIIVQSTDGFDPYQTISKNLLIPDIQTDDPILLQGQLFGKVFDLAMVIFITKNQQFANNQFVSVIATGSLNPRYSQFETGQRDDIIGLFVGWCTEGNQKFDSQILLEIEAQTFNLDRLTVNDVQLICLVNCQDASYNIDNKSILTLIFNDEFNCKIYFVNIGLMLRQGQTSTATIEYWFTIDVKKDLRKFRSLQSYEIDFIRSHAYLQDDKMILNLTTSSIAIDMTVNLQKQAVESINEIFRSYIQCPNYIGSMYSSTQSFLAISCQNASEYKDQQKGFVKLYQRNGSSNDINNIPLSSVVESIQLNGTLEYMDIVHSPPQTNYQMTILELYDREKGQIKYRTFNIDNKLSIKVNQTTPKKIFYVNLCAQNLDLNTTCVKLQISNLGFANLIQNEIVDFIFLVLLPLIFTIISLLCGVFCYKQEKARRFVRFELFILQNRKDKSFQKFSQKNQSVVDSIY